MRVPAEAAHSGLERKNGAPASIPLASVGCSGRGGFDGGRVAVGLPVARLELERDRAAGASPADHRRGYADAQLTLPNA